MADSWGGDPLPNEGGDEWAVSNGNDPLPSDVYTRRDHYIELDTDFCYGQGMSEGNHGFIGGYYNGKPENIMTIQIDLVAGTNQGSVGWDGGVCYLEGHGAFRLEDGESMSTLFIPFAWGTPHAIYCEPGDSTLEEQGQFSISWYGVLQYGPTFIAVAGPDPSSPEILSDASLVIPAAVDSYEANSDWCARSCTLAWDGKCRYFAYDSVTMACRLYAKKGGCYGNPNSWTGRNGESTAYLLPYW